MSESLDPEGYAENVLSGRLRSAQHELEGAKRDEEFAREALADALEKQRNAAARIAALRTAIGKLAAA
jgi:hypothetical protein